MTTVRAAGAAGTREERFRELQVAAFREAGLDASSRYVQIAQPRLRIHVSEVGAGEPVLFIHGGNSVAASWIPLLAPLASRFRLILPDRPGCGLTSHFNYRGVGLRQHAVEFVGGLLDAIGEQRLTVVGNSAGGFFALAFALAHPDRVVKLALLGEPANAAGDPTLFHRLAGTRGINTVLYKTALKPPKDATGVRRGFTRSKIVADPTRPTDALCECLAAAAQIPGVVTSWTTMVERFFEPGGRGITAKRTLGTYTLRPELHTLTRPALFLWGDKDPFGTPDIGRDLARQMPDARLEVIEDAAHLPWIDQPKVCADKLAAFLG